MNMDASYEVVDFRKDAPLAGIAGITLVSGGNLRIDLTDGYGETIVINDEDEGGFIDEDDAGIVELMTPTGRIHLQRMSLPHLAHLVDGGFMDLPHFASDGDMHSYFLELVRFNAHG
jgi:hypothetical protein